MYAVIAAGGKQYRVSEGDVIQVNRLKGNPGDAVEFRLVGLQMDGGQLLAKRADVEKAKVTGKIVAETKGKKIRVFRYKRRKNTMKTKGSRPKFSKVSIEKIIAG